MNYYVKKTITLLITLFAISLCAFLAFRLIPGDPAVSLMGTEATPERLEILREEMGLNEPILIQYLNWMKGFVKGDFGDSYSYKMPVRDLIGGKFVITLTLTVLSVLMLLAFGLLMGMVMAKYKGRLADRLLTVVNQVLMAFPAFFLGIILTFFFGLILKWFQPGGYVSYTDSIPRFIAYLIFPAIAIALPRGAMVAKLLRGSVETELRQEYVKTAYSKGNNHSQVLFGHVLKNAIMPVVTYLAFLIADIVAGSIIIEQVFSIPGIGRLLISSISSRDYPVVQAIIVSLGFIVIIVNFIVDITYGILDPRVKV